MVTVIYIFVTVMQFMGIMLLLRTSSRNLFLCCYSTHLWHFIIIFEELKWINLFMANRYEKHIRYESRNVQAESRTGTSDRGGK